MTVRLEIEEARTRLDRMRRRIDPMVADARKTGLAHDEGKTGVLSDIEDRFAQTADLLREVEQATAEQASRAAEAFEKAWQELEAHVARATRPPND